MVKVLSSARTVASTASSWTVASTASAWTVSSRERKQMGACERFAGDEPKEGTERHRVERRDCAEYSNGEGNYVGVDDHDIAA